MSAAFEETVALRELEAEARHAEDRHRLYRARSYSHLTTPARLRDLERRAQTAKGRLDRARAAAIAAK